MGKILNKIMSGMYSMISSDGKLSLTRFVAILTCIDILAVYTAQNIVAMTNTCSYADFPANTVMVLLVVMGAKVSQKPFEKKTDATENKENKDD